MANPDDTTYFLARRIPVATAEPGMALWRERVFTIMSRNSQNVTSYFNMPSERVIETGSQVEI